MTNFDVGEDNLEERDIDMTICRTFYTKKTNSPNSWKKTQDISIINIGYIINKSEFCGTWSQ